VNVDTFLEIQLMLNIDFMKWIAIAFVIAIPISLYAMNYSEKWKRIVENGIFR